MQTIVALGYNVALSVLQRKRNFSLSPNVFCHKIILHVLSSRLHNLAKNKMEIEPQNYREQF